MTKKCKNISIVIPATNEEIHIERSVKSALNITDHVYVVDSYSKDRTKEIAESLGAKVYEYEWTSESTFARKMNWGLANIPFETEWVMRLDADEYLVEDWSNIDTMLSAVPNDVNGINVLRRLYFLGRWMRHRDNYPRPSMRILRVGTVNFEDRLLDEHIDLNGGKSYDFKLELADNPYLSISDWINKHNVYSTRQAIVEINDELGIVETVSVSTLDKSVNKINKKKGVYSKFPLFWRGLVYFLYRYIFKLGFLDGREGFLWDFFHGWWYRNLVDTKISEIKKACGNDRNKIIEYVMQKYNIDMNKVL